MSIGHLLVPVNGLKPSVLPNWGQSEAIRLKSGHLILSSIRNCRSFLRYLARRDSKVSDCYAHLVTKRGDAFEQGASMKEKGAWKLAREKGTCVSIVSALLCSFPRWQTSSQSFQFYADKRPLCPKTHATKGAISDISPSKMFKSLLHLLSYLISTTILYSW